MFLSRIYLQPRCREARRDLADPYQLHATLCRAFCPPEEKCPPGQVLWRLEPEGMRKDPCILVQSQRRPNWGAITPRGWLRHADPSLDMAPYLRDVLADSGGRFRFRLRANPCVTRNGKRLGLRDGREQKSWLVRQGDRCGFELQRIPQRSTYEEDGTIDVLVRQEQLITATQHSGHEIRIFSVLFDGVLTVTDGTAFGEALTGGIGHGKAFGLGLLSVAPIWKPGC